MNLSKVIFFLVRSHYQILFFAFPRVALKSLFTLFTSPRFQKVRDRERKYLDPKNEERLFAKDSFITFYQWNKSSEEAVLLVHGWEGNAGSMGAFIEPLTKMGYKIIAPNAPGHYSSKGKRCTIRDYQNILEKLISQHNVQYIIAHSFGSAAAALAMQSMNSHQIQKFTSISAPNRMKDVVSNFARLLKLSDAQKTVFYEFVEEKLNLSFDQAVVSKILSENPVKLMVIHDKADALVPIENAHRISSAHKDSQLHLTEERGHYRILWDEKVINQTRNFLAQKDNDQMKSSINFFTPK